MSNRLALVIDLTKPGAPCLWRELTAAEDSELERREGRAPEPAVPADPPPATRDGQPRQTRWARERAEREAAKAEEQRQVAMKGAGF